MKWQGLPESKNVEDRRKISDRWRQLGYEKPPGWLTDMIIDTVAHGAGQVLKSDAARPDEAYDEESTGPASGVDPYKLKEYRKRIEK